LQVTPRTHDPSPTEEETKEEAIMNTEKHIRSGELHVTLRNLLSYQDLRREIALDQERLEKLRQELESPATSNVSEMPKNPNIANRLEKLSVEMLELDEIISLKQLRCLRERKQIEEYIAAIQDSQTRQIFTLRFLEGKTWARVAIDVGGNNADSVRKTCARHIKKYEM
jgi:predicted nuclease with TOPRIM domain